MPAVRSDPQPWEAPGRIARGRVIVYPVFSEQIEEARMPTSPGTPGYRSEIAQRSADGPREIHHAALRSAFDLFDSDGSRVVASALGGFPAARRSAGSDERSPHHVVERSTYAASDWAVFI